MTADYARTAGRIRRGACALCLAAVLLTAGCYTYTPAGADALRPGVAVRARLSSAGVAALGEALPAPDRSIEGEVVSSDTTGLLLLVPAVRRETTAGALQTLRQRIRVPRSDIIEVETKRLDRVKTGALLVGAAVAGALLASEFVGGPSSSDRRPGDPPESVVPVRWLRIPVR